MSSIWTILRMSSLPDVNGKIDFVWEVIWQCYVTYNGVTTSMSGNVILDPENPEINYTPYADLTEDQVVSWVKTALGPDKVAQTEAVLTAQAQAVILPLPWA